MNISRTKFGGAMLVMILLAAIASAQDRYVWSGVRIQGGKREGKAASAMSEAEVRDAKRADPAAALSKELAEIRLLADVDRKVEEASKRLEDLWIRAAWELDYPGRLDVLVSVAKARADLFAKLGRGDDAARAIARLLPDDAAKRAAPTYELVPAGAKILEEEQRGLKDSRLGTGDPTIAGTSQPSDEIEDAVVKAFQSRQYKVVEDIGSRAAPALEKLALANADELVETNAEPLWFLFRIAPDRGAKFALESYDRGGFFWHKRILNSMRARGSEENSKPAWAPVAARLIDDPEIRRDALVLVTPFAHWDVLSPELQAAIVRALDGADSDLSSEILRVLGEGIGRPSVRPVLEAMVRSPIVEVRHTAASWMRAYASSETMLRLVDDQDPEMRRLLASFLTPATANQPRNPTPLIDSRARDILAKLARDPEPSVRAKAVDAIAELTTPLDADVYTALARDTDAKVLDAVDRMLGKLAISDAEIPQWYLSVLARRRANSTLRMGANWNNADVSPMLLPVLHTKAGAQAATEWALEDGDDRTFRAVAGLIAQWPGTSDNASWESGDRGGTPALDDPTLGRVYRRAFAVSRDDVFTRLQDQLWRLRFGGKLRTPAMMPIMQDATASRELRTLAARVASTDASVDTAAIVSFLLDATWSNAAPSKTEERTISDIGTSLQEVGITTVLHRVVESKDVADTVAISLLLGMMNSGGDPSLVRPILDRWLSGFLSDGSKKEASGLGRLLSWALQRIPAEHDDKASKDLLRSLDDGRLQAGVLAKMGLLRWPEFQDPIGERVRKGDASAVQALGGYMNDRTVEYLLEGISRSPYDEFRKACLDQLEAIRRYQDEKARWATRKGGEQARDEAIAQLLPMLSDGDEKVRVQAILSLATLDAVEHLPKFVTLLKDKSPAVRQAAQQALDKLNTREAKKP